VSTLTRENILQAKRIIDSIGPIPNIVSSSLIEKTVLTKNFKSKKKRLQKKFHKKYSIRVPDLNTVYVSNVNGFNQTIYCHPLLKKELNLT